MSERITQVIPADRHGLLVEFAEAGLRVFQPRRYFQQQPPEAQYNFLVLPPKFRHLTWNAHQVHWPAVTDRELCWDGHNVWPYELTLSAEQLLELSEPFSETELPFVSYPLAMQNRAPTDQDARHHVFFVGLKPFCPQPFCVGESIGGGHGERGGSNAFTFDELMDWAWKPHFELSGCGWAIDVICQAKKKGSSQDELVAELINLNGIR